MRKPLAWKHANGVAEQVDEKRKIRVRLWQTTPFTLPNRECRKGRPCMRQQQVASRDRFVERARFVDADEPFATVLV